MLSQSSGKQLSFYDTLYDRIPKDHLLKKIDAAVDFSFINELLVDSYSRTLGRPAKEPELMMKLLFLEYLYNQLRNSHGYLLNYPCSSLIQFLVNPPVYL